MLSAVVAGLALLSVSSLQKVRPLVNGADSSFIPEYRDKKVDFKEGGKPTEVLDSLKNNGVNLLRLRVWVNPKDKYCSPEQTYRLAEEATKKGMRLMIDFHYSDWWADPGSQTTPAAWKDMKEEQLGLMVYQHTKEVLGTLVKMGCTPDYVQIGNEIRTGMLWPTGKIETTGFDPLARLLKQGFRGAREATKGKNVKLIVHSDAGGDLKNGLWYFGELKKRGVKPDVIGLSYYPWWHGTLNAFTETINGLAEKFETPVMVVETAYPFTLKWQDKSNNFVGEEKQLVPGFPATPEGQAAFLRKINDIVRAVPKNRGVGVVYWAPEYVTAPGVDCPWENLALWDFDRNLIKDSMRALGDRN